MLSRACWPASLDQMMNSSPVRDSFSKKMDDVPENDTQSFLLTFKHKHIHACTGTPTHTFTFTYIYTNAYMHTQTCARMFLKEDCLFRQMFTFIRKILELFKKLILSL